MRGHLVDYALATSRDVFGFSMFFYTYEYTKRRGLEMLGIDGKRPVEGVFGWTQGDLSSRLATTAAAGTTAGIVFGITTEPLETYRQGWYNTFMRKSEGGAGAASAPPNTSTHARIVPRAADLPLWRASARLLRNYAAGVLRNVPANALSITVYELAKMTLE